MPNALRSACLAVSLLAAACGADDAVEPQAIPAAPAVCATLDYDHKTPAADFYQQFASDDEAGAYAEDLIRSGVLAASTGANAKFKEISHDPRITGMVDSLLQGFQRVFPKELAGITTPPRVVVVESAVLNAYALGPRPGGSALVQAGKAPWLFVVHTALLNHDVPDVQLKAVLAHELGHLFLRTFLPEIQQRVRTYYALAGSEDGVIGSVQESDPPVRGHVDAMLDIQQRVGGLPRLGFPVLQGQYVRLFQLFMGSAPKPVPQACTTASAQIAQQRSAVLKVLPQADQGNLVPRALTADEQQGFDAQSLAIAASLRACLPSPVAPLAYVVALLNSLPPEAADPSHPRYPEVLALMLDAERQVDAASGAGAALADRILRAQDLLLPRLAALQEDAAFPLPQLRVFDYEEDADDASVRVLRALGDDPLALGGFFLSILTPAARAACLDDLAAGRTIAYGNLIDIHPATCWRYYHSQQLNRALDQCPAAAMGAQRAMQGRLQTAAYEVRARAVEPRGYGLGRR